MKKNIENWIENKIGWISLVLAILSLTSTFLSIYTRGSRSIMWFSSVFEYVNLSFMNLDFFHLEGGTFSGESTFFTNGLNLIFNFVFLLASIFYLYSKKTEKHLLQFIYAVIYFYVAISLLLYLFSQFSRFTLLNPISIGFFIRNLILLLFSYFVLKITDKKLRLIIEKKESNDSEKYNYIKASKYKRFLHLIIDTFLFISLTFRMFKILPRDFLNGIVKLLGERYTLTFLFVISSVIYYTFFEVLLKRTPAKYLTQTFVVGTKNTAIKFGDVITRSFSRKIPLNIISFLGNTSTGWHDSISNTTVVSLHRNKKNNRYLLLIPAIALFLFLNNKFNKFREDYVSYKKENGIILSEVKAIKNKLENLEVNDIISLKHTGDDYHFYYSYFLKVLRIEGEWITLAKIKGNGEQRTLEELDIYHEFNTSDFEEIKVTKEYITKGICNTYSFFNGYENGGFKYFEDQDNMRVYAINSPFEPVVYFDRMFRNSTDRITVYLENKGVVCQLKKVEVLEGDVEVNTTLPQKITRFNDNFKLSIQFKEKTGRFKLLLVFKDEIDERVDYKYIYETDGVFENSFKRESR